MSCYVIQLPNSLSHRGPPLSLYWSHGYHCSKMTDYLFWKQNQVFFIIGLYIFSITSSVILSSGNGYLRFLINSKYSLYLKDHLMIIHEQVEFHLSLLLLPNTGLDSRDRVSKVPELYVLPTWTIYLLKYNKQQQK